VVVIPSEGIARAARPDTERYSARMSRAIAEKAGQDEEDSSFGGGALSRPESRGGERGELCPRKCDDLHVRRWENVLPGSNDPFARIMDMDRDGVEAEVLYCGCLRKMKMVPLLLGGA